MGSGSECSTCLRNLAAYSLAALSRNTNEQGCGIKGFIPASVIQGNPIFLWRGSLMRDLYLVSPKWAFLTALQNEALHNASRSLDFKASAMTTLRIQIPLSNLQALRGRFDLRGMFGTW